MFDNVACLFAASMVFYVANEVVSKMWGNRPTPVLFVSSLLITVFTNGFWLAIMAKRNQLVLMGSIWLVLSTVLTVFIGIVCFHERLTAVQWAGVGTMLVGLCLLSTR